MGNRYTRLAGNVWLSLFGNERARYEAHHGLLTVVAERLSHKIYNKHLTWMQDAEFIEQWGRFPEATIGIADRKYTLYQLAKSVRDVVGDTVECGVLRGAGSHLIMAAQGESRRHHYIFDSFQGLSTPGKNDTVMVSRTYQWNEGDLSVDESIVRNNLRQFERVSYMKGWIPERFSEVSDREFSFVHIDVDLYEPTLASYEFFYPRLARGGLIVCDDYGHLPCPGAMRAVDEFLEDKVENILHLPTGQGVIWKC